MPIKASGPQDFFFQKVFNYECNLFNRTIQVTSLYLSFLVRFVLFWRISPFTMSFLLKFMCYFYVHWNSIRHVTIFVFNHQTFFKEQNRIRIVYYIYPDIYYSFILDVLSSFLISFLHLWGTSFKVYFRTGLWQWISMFIRKFILPILLKDIFTGYRLLSWEFFFSLAL